VRIGPAAFVVSAVIALSVTIAAATFAPALARSGDSAYTWSGGAMCLSDLALLIGVVALARSGAVRDGWLRNVGFFLAIVGSAGIVVAEALLRIDHDAGNGLFNVVGPMQAIGFIVVGVGVILTKAWTGWRRFVPLAMGIYVPAILVPAINASGGENLLALAGYHSLVLLVGIAYGFQAPATATLS
jgi:hypothetical protein